MLVINSSVVIIDIDIPVLKYVMETLEVDPMNPILDKFNKKDTLVETDLLLEFGETPVLLPDIINDIESATVAYNTKCADQVPQKECYYNAQVSKR